MAEYTYARCSLFRDINISKVIFTFLFSAPVYLSGFLFCFALVFRLFIAIVCLFSIHHFYYSQSNMQRAHTPHIHADPKLSEAKNRKKEFFFCFYQQNNYYRCHCFCLLVGVCVGKRKGKHWFFSFCAAIHLDATSLNITHLQLYSIAYTYPYTKSIFMPHEFDFRDATQCMAFMHVFRICRICNCIFAEFPSLQRSHTICIRAEIICICHYFLLLFFCILVAYQLPLFSVVDCEIFSFTAINVIFIITIYHLVCCRMQPTIRNTHLHRIHEMQGQRHVKTHYYRAQKDNGAFR